METNGNFVDTVNRVIDASGQKQEALARDAGVTPGYFSKVLSGQQGALDLVDKLPVEVQQDIAKEYAESFGLKVVEPSPGELDAQVFEAIDRLVVAVKLAKVGRATQARAELRTNKKRRTA